VERFLLAFYIVREKEVSPLLLCGLPSLGPSTLLFLVLPWGLWTFSYLVDCRLSSTLP